MIDKQELLDQVCHMLSLKPVKLLKFDGFRWILEDRDLLGPDMIKIERELQSLTGRPIDLRVQAKGDKNKRFDRNYLRGVEKL